MSPAPFLVFGHRGAAGHAPENTLLSVSRAIEFGADGVEVDVRTCLGGELVVFHDEDLGRVTGKPGRVEDAHLARLRSLDAGGGERIPLAEEVLDLVRGRALLNLEIKNPRAAEPLAELLRETVAGGHDPDALLVSSFEAASLESFRKILPAVPIALLAEGGGEGFCERALMLGARFLNLGLGAATRGRIEEARRHGLDALVYTVNDPEEIRNLSAMGALGVFTDFPDRALSALGRSPTSPVRSG